MKKVYLLVFGVLLAFSAAPLFADGCYICSSGSADQCKDYCRYSGSDNSENRKKCEKAGCKIGGTASCPTAVNYKICSAKLTQGKTDLFALYR